MNKTSVILACSIALCFAQQARCELFVYEYAPGQKVTLDDNTGNYWYWKLSDFASLNYDEQQTSIAGLGTYGDIAGGWHMAGKTEMEALWSYDEPDISASFSSSSLLGGLGLVQYGRYDEVPPYYPTFHYRAELTPPYKKPLDNVWLSDTLQVVHTGAWVTTDATVVPVPSSFILAASGLLTYALGLNRWRRKH